MAAVMGPRYISALELSIASSAHEDYHPRAIQLHGRVKPFDATTTSKDVYKQWELPKRPQPVPPPAPVHLPFQATSAYTDNFPAHPIEPKAKPQPVPFKGSGVKFEAQSTYAGNFHAHEIALRPPQPPVVAVTNPTRFDGTTTNKETYKQHPIEPRKVAAVEYEYRPLPFEATTEKQESYKVWELPKRPTPIVPPMRPTLPFEGTTTSREVFKGWQLPPSRGSLGIATVGDAFHVLIPAAVKGPCTVKQVFTTVHPGQREVCLMLCQGEATVASRNKLLGQFHLVGLPEAPVGTPQIEVAFHLSRDNVFTAEARDLDSGRHHVWQSDSAGGMIASGINPADLKDGVLRA